jgi:hypothetical protein
VPKLLDISWHKTNKLVFCDSHKGLNMLREISLQYAPRTSNIVGRKYPCSRSERSGVSVDDIRALLNLVAMSRPTLVEL